MFLMWQIYAEMIGNVMIDARSTGKYYHCKYINIQVKNHSVVIHHTPCRLPSNKSILLLIEALAVSMIRKQHQMDEIIIP